MPPFDFLRTRVARRVLLAFVLGTILPVTLLGGISFVAVTDQLEDQSRAQLRSFSKNAGMSVMERMLVVETGLRRVAATERAASEGRPLDVALPLGVDRLFLHGPGAVPPQPPQPPQLDAEAWAHLRSSGRAVVRRVASPEGHRYWMAVPAGPTDGDGLLWGRLNESYLWESATQFVDLPTVGAFCILDPELQPLHCTEGSGEALPAAVALLRAPGVAGVFDWSDGGEPYLGAYWQIFLPATYQTDPWTAVVAESRAAVFQPVESFAFTFPLVLLLGISLVLLMANVQVRRTMEPLAELTEGTRRIGLQDLGARVEVKREDEFGLLADSFNRMAERLSLQFRQLEAGRAIDRAVLGAMEREGVVEAVLKGVESVIPSSRAVMVLLESGTGTGATVHRVGPDGVRVEEQLVLPVEERGWMESPQDGAGAPGIPAALRVLGFTGTDRPLLVFTLRAQGEVRGALVLESPDGSRFDEEAVARGRQLLDQASVALDEVRLLQELEDMSWGTLRALARAIDAKSRWTAGHSERVVELALELGRELDLSERDMETLHRGGLLHDLGKIGVSGEVLDFPGPLSAEARRQIEEHTIIGARILEPVRAFEPVLPIVLSHHERWDGQGYPHRLQGREIHRLARILAVPDTFDALTSPRPYRQPLSREAVMDHILGESGGAFEPEVVEAFQRVVSRWQTTPTPEEEPASRG